MILLFLFTSLAFGQNPYVTVTGTVQGPNGLPATNQVISFTPTQQFFVAGLGSSTCSSYNVDINSGLLTCGDTINFNNTLPSAPPNGLNIQWQTSKSGTTDSVSAALVGDGNANHCLTGIGTWANCLPPGLAGDIIRFNVAGDSAWDSLAYSQPTMGVIACSAAAGCEYGISPGSATGCCGESVSLVNPTSSFPFQMETYSAGASPSTNGIIGLQAQENGNTGNFFIRGFWRMHHLLSVSLQTNNRYWWGLGVWGNGSTLGTNGTNILGTTVWSTDTPNHTFVGWRASGGTDTNYEAEVIQAGVSPTTVAVNTGVAIDGNVHAFDVVLDQPNTNYNFYIDGNHVATIAASTIAFTPVNAVDVLGAVFFSADNKNTATGVSLTFGRMTLDPR